VTEELLFVATSSGRLFVLDARSGGLLFTDQAPDLNEVFGLGLDKPHHASMNGGIVVADGRVFVPHGAQNNPSGGIFAYEVNHRPLAAADVANVSGGGAIVIDAIANDADPDGDPLRFARVAGVDVDDADGTPDSIALPFGTVVVFNPGDDPADPDAAYLEFIPAPNFKGRPVHDRGPGAAARAEWQRTGRTRLDAHAPGRLGMDLDRFRHVAPSTGRSV